LEILNPWLAPKIRGVKDTYLDVRARLQDGRQVIIEMQVLNVEASRSAFFTTPPRRIHPVAHGRDYTELVPVIALT